MKGRTGAGNWPPAVEGETGRGTWPNVCPEPNLYGREIHITTKRSYRVKFVWVCLGLAKTGRFTGCGTSQSL